MTQSYDRVDADGATGGDHAAEDACQSEDERDGSERHRVGGRDADQERAEDASDSESGDESEDQPRDELAHALHKNQAQDS